MYYNFYMEEKQASGLWTSTTEDTHNW